MQNLIDKYGTFGVVKVPGTENEVSIINLPMMSDEKWQQSAKENAVSNYRREFGKDPASIEDALQWQRERVAAICQENVLGQ